MDYFNSWRSLALCTFLFLVLACFVGQSCARPASSEDAGPAGLPGLPGLSELTRLLPLQAEGGAEGGEGGGGILGGLGGIGGALSQKLSSIINGAMEAFSFIFEALQSTLGNLFNQ